MPEGDRGPGLLSASSPDRKPAWWGAGGQEAPGWHPDPRLFHSRKNCKGRSRSDPPLGGRCPFCLLEEFLSDTCHVPPT